MLKNKKFLICVSGGIAIYKALELVRFIKKMGGEVRVVMSNHAQKFITPLSFEALSLNPVLFDGSEDWSKEITHIAYASWADVCILAPATINSLSKFACGIADNVMLSTLLACDAPKVIAPAANTSMFFSDQAQENLAKLEKMGCKIVEPREDLLACGVYGKGALQEIEEIAYVAIREVFKNTFWSGKKVIVSGGGSSEQIDEVRCITNHSSGLQASYFALALFLLGAEVIFISSKFPIFLPSLMQKIEAQSLNDFYQAILESQQGSSYYFGIAALSDFAPKEKIQGKLKKQKGLKVEFVENLDILKELKGIKKIGFKAEKDVKNAKAYAKAMLREKDCEFVCLNILGDNNPFGSCHNAISLLGKEVEIDFALKDKFSLAFEVLSAIEAYDR